MGLCMGDAAPGTAQVPSVATAVSNAIPKIDIADGLSVTRVIKGCWQLSGGHRGDKKTDRTVGAAALEDFQAFANAGITSWDCADHYGPAEVLIGRYLKEHPEQASDIQVLTKLCVFSGMDMATINQSYIDRAVDTSRNRLGQPSVDLMQFYWGDYGVNRYTDAVKYLGDTQARGKVKHIGLTNFDVPRCKEIVDTGVKIASNQLQYSLLDTRPANGMAEFCIQNNIAMLPYGVVAGGFLTERYLGLSISDVKVDTSSKSKYGSVILKRGGWDWFQALLLALHGIAQKHDTSIANVATRWVLDQPGVAGVILGARNANHIADHTALFQLALDDADRAAIDNVLSQGNAPKGDCYAWERGLGPF